MNEMKIYTHPTHLNLTPFLIKTQFANAPAALLFVRHVPAAPNHHADTCHNDDLKRYDLQHDHSCCCCWHSF